MMQAATQKSSGEIRVSPNWMLNNQQTESITSSNSGWSNLNVLLDLMWNSDYFLLLLNSIIKTCCYTVININLFNSQLVNKRCFSKINLTFAYDQIWVHPVEVPESLNQIQLSHLACLSSIICLFRKKKSAATFQRFID